jgi:hypothetical protein
MSPVRHSICKFILVAVAASMSGACVATDRLEHRLKVGEPVSQVFFAKYEEVEAALKLSMLRYPQRIDNTEAGIFETDYVKGDLRFRPPHKTSDYPSGMRYRLIVRLVRGKSVAKPAVQVVVIKQIEMSRDFFAEPQNLQSDGLEEQTILYRIGRELTIGKALQKSNEQNAKKAKDRS